MFVSAQSYDIVILGGGTGGYVAAIRAAQLGKTVAVVEREKLGGTCLHRGCIPSKALLRSAEVYATMKNSEAYGITQEGLTLNFNKVQDRKQSIVDQLHKGVQFLMKKNKIDVIEGKGRIIGPSIFSPRSGAVAVEQADGEMLNLVAQNTIIATGSRPRSLSGLEIDGQFVLTSDEALELEQLPQSIIIIGGGVIGVEWASMLNDFGVEVTLVEADKRLLPTEDEDVSKELQRLFKKRKIKVLTDAKVQSDSLVKEGSAVRIQADYKGEVVSLEADKILVAVGRQANADGIGLENTDIRVEKGFIAVNPYMQTTESHIYAIGDVNGGLQLAHVASHEGIAAVEHIAGIKQDPLPHHRIPRCVYTRPEVASVGWTEQQAKDLGHDVKVGSVQFRAIGKALVYGEYDGFAKVIADAKTNDILGVHLIGPHATDYISEAALAQFLEATPWEVGKTMHPHPTLSEILGEAMLAVDGSSVGI
jgi:dihydrolipoamide dehydrogenase